VSSSSAVPVTSNGCASAPLAWWCSPGSTVRSSHHHHEIVDDDGELGLRFQFALTARPGNELPVSETELAAQMTSAYRWPWRPPWPPCAPSWPGPAQEEPDERLPIPPETATETAAPASADRLLRKVDSLDNRRRHGRLHPRRRHAVRRGRPPFPATTAIRAGLNGLFSILDSMKHAIHRIWISTDTTLMEATVTYYMTGGRQVPIPVVYDPRAPDRELIADIRIVIDRVPMTA